MTHRKHLYICLLMVAGYGLGYVLIPSVRELGWFGLFILACPLVHLLMVHEVHKHNWKGGGEKW